MSTEKNIHEDKMDDINPNEIGVNHPAKDRTAVKKPEIKESEIGRESSQMPADEHIEHRIGQIDEGTVKMQEDKNLGEPLQPESDAEEGRDNAGYNNDGASQEDWKKDDKEAKE